jgi:hypothetical protein
MDFKIDEIILFERTNGTYQKAKIAAVLNKSVFVFWEESNGKLLGKLIEFDKARKVTIACSQSKVKFFGFIRKMNVHWLFVIAFLCLFLNGIHSHYLLMMHQYKSAWFKPDTASYWKVFLII